MSIRSPALVCAVILYAWFFASCGTADQVAEEQATPRTSNPACAEEVRRLFERADATVDTVARIAVLEEGLAAMPREGGAHCERELLVELAELHAGTGRTERLISVCEAAIRPSMGLDAQQTARLKMKLAQAYFQAGLPRSFDLAKDVFLYLEEMNVRSDRMLEATDLLVRTYELAPRPEVYLNLDMAQRGLGTASCGPDTLPQYCLLESLYRFAYRLSAE